MLTNAQLTRLKPKPQILCKQIALKCEKINLLSLVLSSFLHFFFPVYFPCKSDLHPSFLSSSFSVSSFLFVCLSRFFVCLVSFLSVCLLNFLLPFCFSLSSFPVVYLPFFLPVCLTSFLFIYCCLFFFLLLFLSFCLYGVLCLCPSSF